MMLLGDGVVVEEQLFVLLLERGAARSHLGTATDQIVLRVFAATVLANRHSAGADAGACHTALYD
jgi:hypothetical protein